MTVFLYIIVMLLNIFMIGLSIRKLGGATGRDNRLIAFTLMIGFAMLVMHLTVTPIHFANLGEVSQSAIIIAQGVITSIATIILIRRY